MSVQESDPDPPASAMLDPLPMIKYVNRSCNICHLQNPLRQKMIKLVTSSGFDNFITFLIVANCVFLAIDGPTDAYDPNNLTTKQVAIWYAEYIFLVLFTMEMTLKIIAFGFCFGQHTYMKNQWNWLDFSVVIIGYMGFIEIPGFPNLSSLRTFRVLRPLRTLTTVPGMKVIVVSMISALPALSGVVALTLGMFFVWSVIGLQLWGGVMQNRCYYPPTRQFDIPLVQCTTESMTNHHNNCTLPPSTWKCSAVNLQEVFQTSDGSAFSFTELMQSHEFALNRTSGLANVPETYSNGKNQCRIKCDGSTKCGTFQNVHSKEIEIMLSLNQSEWITTGELIFARDQWPVPRNIPDYPIDERERHGIDTAATIAKLKLDSNGNEDKYGLEKNKTVDLILYDNIAFSGGWDTGAFCGLPNSAGSACGTEQNGTVTVQGLCKQWWNPMLGNGGFDSVGKAIMVIFTSVTLEGWVDNM